MKKLISYLVAVMMVLTMMPYTAFAVSSENTAEPEIENYSWTNPITENIEVSEEESTEDYSVSTFSTRDTVYTDVEAAAEYIRPYLENRITTFVVKYDLPNTFSTEEEAKAARSAVTRGIMSTAAEHTGVSTQGDAIRWGRHGWQASTSYYTYSTHFSMTITYNVTYLHDAEQELELIDAIDELKNTLNIDDKTDYEKIAAIYDYMTANITYDYDNLEDDTHLLKHSAYAALVNKTSVCQGYAVLFYRLALEYGIDARVIYGMGNGGEHAWNIVKLGDKYYYLDATWDAPRAQAGVGYKYFLKPYLDNHTNDAEYLDAEFLSAYPIADKAYDPMLEPEPEIELTEIILSTDTLDMSCNGSEELIAFKMPAETTNTDSIIWTSSEDSVASVDSNGTVTAAGEGTAVITAAIGDIKATCEVTVTHRWSKWNTYYNYTCADRDAYRYCYDCDRREEKVIPATTDHEWGDWEIYRDATCKDGLKERYCVYCDERDTDVIPATGNHDWSKWNTYYNYTCADRDAYRYCYDCSKREEKVIQATTDHEWDEWEIYKDATCKDGLKERHCVYCDERDTDVIPATGIHDWGEWNTYYNYTCADRDAYRYCYDCSKREKKVIPATTDHEWDEWEVYEEPTCKDGLKVRYCSYCYKCEEAAIPATGIHRWSSWQRNSSNLCCDSKESRLCYDCDKTEEKDSLATKDHNWGDWYYGDEANCIDDGLKWRYCNDCSECEDKIIPATGIHNWGEWEVNYNYTCADRDAYRYCDDCNKREEKVIPATTDHKWEDWQVNEASCIYKGYKWKECTECDKCEYVDLPATGDHDWTKWNVVNAKCTKAGYKWRDCDECGEYEEVTIPAKGHKWENFYTVDKKATTKATGSKSKHCATCNAVKSGSKVTIAKIKNTTANTLVYNGKKRTANVTVVNTKGKKLIKGTDYTVTYKNAKGTKVVTPKNVGTYKAVVKFKGQYSGTVTKTFKINPQGTKITNLTKNGKKQFTVKWTKKTAQVTGYQIKYSTKSSMKNAKTVTVTKAKTTTRTIKKLKAKQKYYVQIRTYKTVNGNKYYSAWSAKKTITTK